MRPLSVAALAPRHAIQAPVTEARTRRDNAKSRARDGTRKENQILKKGLSQKKNVFIDP